MQILSTRRSALPALLAFNVVLVACGHDILDPTTPAVSADVAALDFGALDVDFGASVAQKVTFTNDGTSTVHVGPLSTSGANQADFEIIGSTDGADLAPGASLDVMVVFDPTATGGKTASLEAPTDDHDTGTLTVDLTGSGGDFRFVQVDRVGIPALNTVFNHPPQFSKTDYNVASPMGDLATYRGRFETVLGAVANADPSATAAVLLPDELPVDMGAAVTRFGTLTGRALAEDAVDVALMVVVGVAALQSDNVDQNDVAFGVSFPYLAPPHK